MDLPFTTEELARLYRFALLLTGEEGAAEQVLHDACADCAQRLEGYRNEEGRMACMLGTVRQKAKGAAAPEGRGIAGTFAKLPEEERVALAGLYTKLLPAKALAEALKMPLDRLGRVLKSARENLARAAQAMNERSAEPAL